MLTIMEECQDDFERQKKCRETIRVSTKHLLSLVNDVLEVSKLESGRPAIVEEPFDLHDTLENCITVLSPQAEAAGVRLVLEEVDLRHGRLIGNPLHLKQILMNIIDNGVKYNKPDGFVLVHAKELSCEGDTAQFQFIIEDNGIGIGEDFKKHIFEPFTQENQGARTHYDGAGLGMSIARKIAEQMGGAIHVESQVGKGSTFSVTLPIQIDTRQAARSLDKERNLHAGMEGIHVLLVEDNEINCEIVEFILEQAGAAVVTAHDGKAAVDAFMSSAPKTFDCILMDLMMPVMSGFEATRVIRGMDRPDAKTVPIIALSANAFEEDVAMAKGAGMNEHLAKPMDIDKMFKVMGRLITQQTAS